MELHGEAYLFNFSLVAITFAAVSALVMLIRQSMGTGLTRFDVHLISTYISYGFALSIMALLPPFLSLFEMNSLLLWALSSSVAVVLFLTVLLSVIVRRRKLSGKPAPLAVRASFLIHSLSCAILLLNAVPTPWQGIHLSATSLSVSFGTVMWMFARRIASLFGDEQLKGFDPDRA